MNEKEMSRFLMYREKLFTAIRFELELDGHCKSYEGRLELHFPNYFNNAGYCIHLACYVLGPTRGYDYFGDSWDECLDQAERDLDKWIDGQNSGDCDA